MNGVYVPQFQSYKNSSVGLLMNDKFTLMYGMEHIKFQ